jgi:hypothetical protein
MEGRRRMMDLWATLSDEDLVWWIRERGTPEAWDELARRYRGRLKSLLRREGVSDLEVVEDLLPAGEGFGEEGDLPNLSRGVRGIG